MESPYEVDPCGDVFITLRNPGAPFAELANMSSMTEYIAWFFQEIAKRIKTKKKKKQGKLQCHLISVWSF